jgi:hypothetical protein
MEDRGRNEESGARVAVDAHVHFHPCFDVDSFLSGTLENIRLVSRPAGGAAVRRLKLLERELRRRRSHSNRRLCNCAGYSANDDRNPAKLRTEIWADRILPCMRSRQ